jgi:hypothetical protein
MPTIRLPLDSSVLARLPKWAVGGLLGLGFYVLVAVVSGALIHSIVERESQCLAEYYSQYPRPVEAPCDSPVMLLAYGLAAAGSRGVAAFIWGWLPNGAGYAVSGIVSALVGAVCAQVFGLRRGSALFAVLYVLTLAPVFCFILPSIGD